MTTYLQLNNGHTGDYIKLPSLTLTKVIANVSVRRHTDVTRPLWDMRPGIGFSYLQQSTSGVDVYGSGTVQVNGTTVSNNTTFIPNAIQCTIEHDISGTGIAFIGAYNTLLSGQYADMDVYDIQVFNGSTLIAHYDMSTGTVNDQSGKGNNATLYGGTWVSSGQTTTYVGGGSISSSSSLTSASHVILSDGKAISGNASLTVGEIFSYASNGTLNGQSSLNSNEDMVYLASGTLQSVSSLGSGDSYIGASGTYYSGSGSIISLASLTSSEIEKYSGFGFMSSFASLMGVEKLITEEKGNILTSSLLEANHVNVVFGVRGDILTNASLFSGDLLNGMRGSEQFEDNGLVLMHIGLLSRENVIHLYIPHFPVGEIYLLGIMKNTISLEGKQKNTISLNGVMK